MNNNLKPCPFCGCKYTKDEDDFYYSGDHSEWCPLNYRYPGTITNITVPNIDVYIDAWNRRASDENKG